VTRGSAAPRLVDTHAHLDLLDREGIAVGDAVARARDAGTGRIITVGINLESSREAVRIAEAYEGVFAVIGVHPHDSAGYESHIERELRALAASPRVVAIGEVGLDYYRDHSPRDRQRIAFRHQLDLAAELGLPVCIHCRDASQDCLRILTEHARKPDTVVLHCFSGDERLAAKMVDMGCYISLAGPITFKNAVDAARVAQSVPLDRLLIETDCPYLAPVPYRGKTNEPALLPLIAERIAELRGIPVADVARATTANARDVFDLP